MNDVYKECEINYKLYSFSMMSFNAETEFCNLCKNHFNCNDKNIKDIKNLYKKYKINFNLCFAYMFSFNTETEMYNLNKNNVKFITLLIKDSANLYQFKLKL